MNLNFTVVEKKDYSEGQKSEFGEMLRKQGKVSTDNLKEKLDRCAIACFARLDGELVGIGGIKEKTASDFSETKSGLSDLESEFEWELGYIFTLKEHGGLGIASTVVKLLIKRHGPSNLMASTESTANPAMVKILEKNGFQCYGSPWKSKRHNNFLALFLKFQIH